MQKQFITPKNILFGGMLAFLVLFTWTQVLALGIDPSPAPAFVAPRTALLQDGNLTATAVAGYDIRKATGAGDPPTTCDTLEGDPAVTQIAFDGLCFFPDFRPVPRDVPAPGVLATSAQLFATHPRPVNCDTGRPGGPCSGYDFLINANSNPNHAFGTIFSGIKVFHFLPISNEGSIDFENDPGDGLTNSGDGENVFENRAYRRNADVETLWTVVVEASFPTITSIGVISGGRKGGLAWGGILGPGTRSPGNASTFDQCVNLAPVQFTVEKDGFSDLTFDIQQSYSYSTGNDSCIEGASVLYFSQANCGGTGVVGFDSDEGGINCGEGFCGECTNSGTGNNPPSVPPGLLGLSGSFGTAAVVCDLYTADLSVVVTIVGGKVVSWTCDDLIIENQGFPGFFWRSGV